nr:retrovirus-related Pol polyprotein from transposon TNT 1-94 [Tanacetum cinerariifolium]
MIMDLKLEYQTFRAKPSKSLSQTHIRYNTLLNELANDGVNLSKHAINVGFVNSLPEKWLTFSQGLRNANHTYTIDLADIYGSTDISTAFLSNNVIQDFQEKDYTAEYKKMKAKLAILEANDEEVTEVKVLMALADDELTVGKNDARNDEWIDITTIKNLLLLTFLENSLGITKLRGNGTDLSTTLSKRKIRLRGGVLTESSQSSKSLIGVKCNTCGSTLHFTTAHNEFDHFKRGYSFVSKAFKVFNTRRQVEETYHVTFDESMEAISFTNTSVDEIGIVDSFRYPPDEFIHKDDPSR